MTVSITSKFYQDSAWKDISKIVFTSPNIDSPATAGTRSHILPGQGNLGLWYEDTSNLYRIEDEQLTTDTSYASVTMKSSNSVNLASSPTYIDVYDNSVGDLETYVKVNTDAEFLDYNNDVTSETSPIAISISYGDYVGYLDYIFEDGAYSFSSPYPGTLDISALDFSEYLTFTDWPVMAAGFIAVAEFGICNIDFTFNNPIALCKLSYSPVEVSNVYNFAGDVYFGIEDIAVLGSNDGESWDTLRESASAGSSYNVNTINFLDNVASYKYYRLTLSNTPTNSYIHNSGTVIYAITYAGYGMRALKFYSRSYSPSPGGTDIVLYSGDNTNDLKSIKINNALNILEDTTPGTPQITIENVSGTVVDTVVSGYSTYIVSLESILTPNDYLTQASGVSSTISGSATDTSSTTFVSADLYEGSGTATMGYTSYSGVDYFSFTAINTREVDYEDSTQYGTNNYTYTTTASGIVASPLTLSGTTTRTYVENRGDKYGTTRLYVNEIVTPSGVLTASGVLYFFDPLKTVEMDVNDSILFELTNGEAYNCRLTAWDDTTHSTVSNELIANDHVCITAIAYCCGGSKLNPTFSSAPISIVYPPAYNLTLKGNTVDGDNKYYYGDFDMIYRTGSSIYGDFLMFKPMLYGIHSGISYGVHDFYITLHYSYT